MLWQNAIRRFIKNATKVYYELLRFFITKGRVLLKTKTVITKSGDFMTKCDGYYKMRRLLEYMSV